MFADAAMLTLQFAIIALVVLPVVGLVFGRIREVAREGSVQLAAAPRTMRVAGVSPSRIPQRRERVFATMRARSPGR